MISDGTGNAVELEGEGDADTLEVKITKTLFYSEHLSLSFQFTKYVCV